MTKFIVFSFGSSVGINRFEDGHEQNEIISLDFPKESPDGFGICFRNGIHAKFDCNSHLKITINVSVPCAAKLEFKTPTSYQSPALPATQYDFEKGENTITVKIPDLKEIPNELVLFFPKELNALKIEFTLLEFNVD